MVVEPNLGHIEDGARDILSGNLDKQPRGEFIIKNLNGLQSECHFDVRVFSPTCDLNKNLSKADNFSKMEKIKNKDYAERIKHMLGGNFISCIFSSCGGIGHVARKVIKELATKASSSALVNLRNKERHQIRYYICSSQIKN